MLKEKRLKIKKRIRAKVLGTKETPRLCVYKSNRFIYAQLVDDDKGVTLLSASDQAMKGKESAVAKAQKVGQTIAKEALAKKIKRAVFDRGGYRFHGRVKAVAEGAREGGLTI